MGNGIKRLDEYTTALQADALIIFTLNALTSNGYELLYVFTCPYPSKYIRHICLLVMLMLYEFDLDFMTDWHQPFLEL